MKKLFYYFMLSSLPIMVSGGCASNDDSNANSNSNESNTSSEISSNNNESSTQTNSDSEKNSSNDDEIIFPEEMFYKEKPVDPHFHKNVSDFSTDSSIISNVFNSKYFDEENNLTDSSVTYGEMYLNGVRQENIETAITMVDDAYYFFYGNNSARVISRANGYALTIPTTTTIHPNLECANYRTQYITNDYTLTVTAESSNTYSKWETYHDEWITRYLALNPSNKQYQIDRYFNDNKLKYTKDPIITTEFLEGQEVELISILIEENELIEKPYYNIAIIRKPNEIKEFSLLVMKSKTDMRDEFEKIVLSFKKFIKPYKFGTPKAPDKFELKIPAYLSKETQRYYKKLMEQEYTEWGIFIHSMYANGANTKKIKDKTATFEKNMDYEFGIMPTYTHCGEFRNPTPFPLGDANELAGGNGFNGKPVIQFTLQFTTSNNTGLHGYTPMFDIMRGKYDDYFRSLAKDIKTYGKPVLFRLNNEMNSDWVSYCGAVTLLDPDIFRYTWERMARIFEEEGVDNVLYIFNPTAKSYPYSSWGEDLCYLPSLKYVQIIGLTYYEYNNYFDQDPRSFYDLYKWLYNKNAPWVDFPAIISEFACGAGGNYPDGQLYRNNYTQAVWVDDLFDCLNNYRHEPFVQQIKGAIWFNANDDVGSKTKNLLVLDMEHTPTTINAFKVGLAATKKLKENQ